MCVCVFWGRLKGGQKPFLQEKPGVRLPRHKSFTAEWWLVLPGAKEASQQTFLLCFQRPQRQNGCGVWLDNHTIQCPPEAGCDTGCLFKINETMYPLSFWVLTLDHSGRSNVLPGSRASALVFLESADKEKKHNNRNC